MFRAQVTLLDPWSAVRQHWLDITPGDKGWSAVWQSRHDARSSYVCRFRSVLTNLFLARGLK